MSKLVRCITADGLVMAAAIDSTDIVRKAQELHRTTPVITSALGRLLTGASIMGNKLKEDNASLTLRMNGGGVTFSGGEALLQPDFVDRKSVV